MKGKTKTRIVKTVNEVIYCGPFFILLALYFLYGGLHWYEVPNRALVATSVEAINLSNAEIAQVQDIISDVKPEFWIYQGRIIFVSWTWVNNEIHFNEDGINKNAGRVIYIRVYHDENITKYILCHELLHTYIVAGDEEALVERLNTEEYMPCFKEFR